MSLPIRQRGLPRTAGSPVAVSRDVSTIKSHPNYALAKAGDVDAALGLALDLIGPEILYAAKKQFPPGVTFVPAISREATGHNQIPMAVACILAHQTGGFVETEIVQSNEPHHTGADPMERLRARPLFDGPVEPGRHYAVVDDVGTMFGTLSEMADHIQAGGGEVVGSFVVVNASRSGGLCPQSSHLKLIEERFGNDVREVLGINPSALTRDEAQYLAGFRNAEAFRARAIEAQREAGRRLLSKRVKERYGAVVAGPVAPNGSEYTLDPVPEMKI